MFERRHGTHVAAKFMRRAPGHDGGAVFHYDVRVRDAYGAADKGQRREYRDNSSPDVHIEIVAWAKSAGAHDRVVSIADPPTNFETVCLLPSALKVY